MTDGHDYITLNIFGLATLSSAPIDGAIACLGQPPRVIAAEMDPTQCYPSDAGATFLVNATAEFRSTVMRRGELIGTLTSPIWSGYAPQSLGFHMRAEGSPPSEEVVVWIGNQKARALNSIDEPDWWPRSGQRATWMKFIERGVDETSIGRIDIPFETSMTTRGGLAVTKDRPMMLEGLACEYTMHYADGTARTLMRGQIRSIVDAGDTVSIRIATEVSSIMDQEWLPPSSMPGLGWDDQSGLLLQNQSYYNFAINQPNTPDLGSYAFAPSLIAFDLADNKVSTAGLVPTQGGSTANPIRRSINNPPPYAAGEWSIVPALSFGVRVAAPKFSFLAHDSTRAHPKYFQRHGVDPRDHEMFAAFSTSDPSMGAVLNNNALTNFIDVNETEINKNAFTLLKFDRREERPWGSLGLYGSVAYSVSGESFVPQNWLGERDVFRTTDGVFSAGDGWGDSEELPKIRMAVAGDIIPLPRAIGQSDHPLDFALSQISVGASSGNTYGVGVSGLQASLDLRLDMLDLTPKINDACAQYFSDVYDDSAWDEDELRKVCSVLLDEYNIPIEFVWGRRFKDTFFSDLWAQFAIIFVSGPDARLRPIFLGDSLDTPDPDLDIDVSIIRDRDHSVHFANEPTIGSIVFKDTPERYAYARTQPENIEIISDTGALWGSRGESISVPLSTYMRRDPFSYLRAEQYTGKYSPIDVSIACWSAALRNYSKPFPTVVLVVDGRYKGFPGDVVRVRLPNMPAPDGTIGVDGMRAQIWERGDDVREGTAEIKLLLIGWWDE